MTKLSLNDIKVKTFKEQITEAILMKFDTLEAFSEKIDMKQSTIKQYLKSPSMSTDKFKIAFFNEFGIALLDYYKDDKEQIGELVEKVCKGIKLYNNKEDILVLDALYNLCTTYSLNETIVMKMQIALSLCYFQINEVYRSTAILEAVNMNLHRVNDYNLRIKCKSELGRMYFYLNEYNNAEIMYNEVEKSIKKKMPKNSLVFFHYYRCGILNNNTGKYNSAEKFFRKALKFAKDGYQKTRTIMNIGLSLKHRGKYNAAEKYYFNALDIATNNVDKGAILNNLSQMYKMQDMIDKGIYYIKQAIELVDEDNLAQQFKYFRTLHELKFLKGEKSGFDEILQLILNIKDEFIQKKFILSTIEDIILLSQNDTEQLSKVETLIIRLISETEESYTQYIKELKACLGDICLCYNKIMKGDGVSEENNRTNSNIITIN